MNSEKGLVGSTSIQAAIEIYTENQGRSNSHCYDVANGSKEGTTLVKNAQGNQHKRVDYIQQSITAGEILLKNSYSNTKKKAGVFVKHLFHPHFLKRRTLKHGSTSARSTTSCQTWTFCGCAVCHLQVVQLSCVHAVLGAEAAFAVPCAAAGCALWQSLLH